MLNLLAFIGKRSANVLLVGLVLAAFFPAVSALLRPFLPFMVSMILGISMARLDIGTTLKAIVVPRKAWRLLLIIILLMPVYCFVLVCIWRLLGLDERYVLLIMVFTLAPPLSSSASLCLLLGYDAALSLQVTLLGTLLTPLIGAVCFSLLGVAIDLPVIELGMRITAMIGGGLLLGLSLQAMIGKSTIAKYPDVFNGLAALMMIVFLFPVFDGVFATVIHQPLTTVWVLLLAVALNFGTHLWLRRLGRPIAKHSTAAALGLSFGNRNVAFYLAALPIDPLLSLFVGVSQIPMYATPAVFGKRKTDG